MKILVVDDDEYFLVQMEKLLKRDGHSVTISSSTKDALDKINYFEFDLILTDLKMPKYSGIDLIKKAKAAGNKSIFIVITGYGTIESAVEAIKIGAYDYILKPFEMPILRKKINEISKNVKLRELITAPTILEKLDITHVFDYEIIRKQLESYCLIISDKDPKNLAENLHIENYETIQFEIESREDILNELKREIKKFSENNTSGTIIVSGIETLPKKYDWNDIRKFLVFIQYVLTKEIKLIILLENKDALGPLKETFSLLLSPTFEKIVEIIAHPLRKRIITTLRSNLELSYNELLTNLEIESSPVLAFHLKKLIKEEILQKTKKETSYYTLSNKGIYLAEVISVLEDLGSKSPFSSFSYRFIADKKGNEELNEDE